MFKIKFLDKIDEIKKCLNYELFYTALAMSLTLPDICSQHREHEYKDRKNK